MPSKIGKVRDAKLRNKWRLGARQVCFVCDKPAGGFGMWLECAHIVGGSGRSDEWCNLTLLCNPCHSSTHGITTVLNGVRTEGYKYTTADMLRGKKKHDPRNFNLARLVELRGEPLPEVDLT